MMVEKEQQINELVMQVVKAAMDCSHKTDYNLFIYIAPHTNQIDINTTHKSNYKEVLTADTIYLNFETEEEHEELYKKLKTILYGISHITLYNSLDNMVFYEKDCLGRNRLAAWRYGINE